MKIKNTTQVDAFLNAVNKCEGNVYLRSVAGDVFNLKSTLSQYVAIGKLLDKHGDELELFCDNKADEGHFLNLFNQHPEILK